MHADKLVLAAVAVACLLVAGRAHGMDGYVPAAASQQVEEPLATNQNDKFLPQPEVMPVPTQLFKRPGFAVYAPQKKAEETTQPDDAATLAGALQSASSYFPQEPTTTTTTTEPEPAPETTTEPEPAPETTTEPEPASETTTEPEPAAETTTEPEDEPAPATTTGPEPVTPTAPGQGDFYRTGETPTKPEPPAVPSSPASGVKFSYSAGGGGGSKQVDDDGEPVDGLSPKAIENILKEHNLFRAKEGERPLTWNATVAKYAQQYANERKGDCALKHSTGPYGENLMYGDGKSWTWRHTVDEWSAEKKNYHYGSNSCDAGSASTRVACSI